MGAQVAKLGLAKAATIEDVKAAVLLPTWNEVNVSYDLLLDRKRLQQRSREMEAIRDGLEPMEPEQPPLTFGLPVAGAGGAGAGASATTPVTGPEEPPGTPKLLGASASSSVAGGRRPRRRRWRRWCVLAVRRAGASVAGTEG